MQVTEYQRHQLFTWFEEQMGAERAATMMSLVTNDEIRTLEERFEAKVDRLETRLTVRFVGWLLATQAATIAVVGAITALR